MTHPFDKFVRAKGLTDASVATVIGRDRSLVSRLRHGRCFPSLETAAIVEDEFGFAMRDWLPVPIERKQEIASTDAQADPQKDAA